MAEAVASDLDVETPSGTSGVVVPSRVLPTPDAKSETADDRTRRGVSFWLLALLTFLLIISFLATFVININYGTYNFKIKGGVFEYNAKEQAEFFLKVLNIVFGPVVTLVSSVVGFYFGARTANENR